MALIACPECGHQISSQARFCPKCRNSKNKAVDTPPDTAAPVAPAAHFVDPAAFAAFAASGEDPGTSAPREHRQDDSGASSNKELQQLHFEPSLDETMIMEGRAFLVRGILNVSDCYAYLTSKRYALCDASGVNIVFQIGNNGFASIDEGRHLISKKIIINTLSGETYQIKNQSHDRWMSALLDPQGCADALKKSNSAPPAESADPVEWYYEAAGNKTGPVQEKNMIRYVQNNHTIYRNTRVWNSYLPEWKRAEETILAFYFCDSGASGTEAGAKTGGFGRSGLSLSSRILRLLKRYI